VKAVAAPARRAPGPLKQERAPTGRRIKHLERAS
jgi:hypothetical protein